MIILGLVTARAFAAPPPAPAPAAKPLLADEAAHLDSAIADLLQKRGGADTRNPLIDLQIDLRVMARWAYARSADAPPASELQVCSFLRAVSLLWAADSLAQKFEQSSGILSSGQLDGLKKLHELTYKLPDAPALKDVDEICRSAGDLLISVAGPLDPQVKSIPVMRPPVPDDAPAAAAEGPPSITDLARRGQALTVSPALQRQIVTLTVAAVDPQPKADAANLAAALSDAIGLAEALQRNIAVDVTTRPKLEAQLAEAAALYADSRMRAIGRQHLDGMAWYRTLVQRIGGMRLKGSMQERLGPTFVWAQQNPGPGAKTVDAIDAYLRVASRFDARKEAAGITAPQRKAIDELSKQFASQRTAFLDDIDGVARGTIGPDALQRRLDQLSQTMVGIDANDALPKALQVLSKFKSRPFGGLEKHAALEAVNTASTSSVVRDTGVQFLTDTEHLAQLATAMAEPLDPPADIARNYGGGKVTAFVTKSADLITELATELASGKPFDRAKLAQLEIARDLADALRTAPASEAALTRGDLLYRWADWSIDTRQIRALLAPYREATSAAVVGVVQGDGAAIGTWPSNRRRYAPLLALLVHDGGFADACAKFPGGVMTEPAKLATPMDGQPFATERYASFALWFGGRLALSGDMKSASAVADALAQRLRNDLRLGSGE